MYGVFGVQSLILRIQKERTDVPVPFLRIRAYAAAGARVRFQNENTEGIGHEIG